MDVSNPPKGSIRWWYLKVRSEYERGLIDYAEFHNWCDWLYG